LSPSSVPAVEVGHHDVEQDDVGAAFARLLDGVGTAGGHQDVVALFAEVVADQLGDVPFVLDHEHAGGSTGGRGGCHRPRVSALGVTGR
jgi:hypothetical protein